MKKETHEWQYCSLGGVIRVKIASGDDLVHLGELDQKYWTVLSCPVSDLQMDKNTLDLLDTDKDGRIKVHEVVSAANWLCSVIKDKDLILKGEDVLAIDNIDCSSEEGARLHDSALRILKNLGLEKTAISVAEASDSVAIFKNTVLNGDGVIVPSTAASDMEAKKAIEDCISSVGSVIDRCGEAGVNTELVETFYVACADYAEWMDSRALPYGAATADAYSAFEAVKAKVEDYFTRCKLLSYDPAAASAVAVSVDKIDEISSCPIARPESDGVLPFKGLNPAWQAAFDRLVSLLPQGTFASSEGVTEAEWNAVVSSFGPYCAWTGSKKGSQVEALGIDEVKAVLSSNKKQALLDLIAEDKALEQESNSIDDVKKLMLFYRDFARLLDNYIIFDDFYKRVPGRRAIFEAGRLYIDQRCCDLCVRVSDMGQHADMAKLSGMFLIYCKCVSKTLGKAMDIVAVMTDGDTEDLRPGKNGVFFDCDGRDWDATVTKIVDNPISIKQAFWSPYRKFWEFCVGLINKSAADKDAKMMSEMQAKATQAANSAPAAASSAEPATKAQAFDIAKFAGIFAALGMALGYIGSFLTSIVTGIKTTPPLQLLLIILVLMLVISGPSCFIAWSKLRKRNLGPVLNANGWAINSKVLVNIVFGAKLTSVAKYPKLKIFDPYRQKSSAWKWILGAVVLVLAVLVTLQLCGVVTIITICR
ncbi:MAG TPA: hypothetical protein DDX33_06755 [Rikenellaceae bacterium]|nr:hypothetical protein [Rikenellaceae bacterium]